MPLPDRDAPGRAAHRFAGRTALVTGGGSDIGLAIARRLMAEGARVLLTDLEIGRIERELTVPGAADADCLAVAADLSQGHDRDRLVGRLLERWGTIDVLVNNAAVQGERTAALDIPSEAIERIFSVNLGATFALCQRAGREMAAHGGGAIVNITSIQTHMPVPSYAAYVASKGAVGALTRALAVEFAGRGIRVNAVAPGVIATAAFAAALGQSRGSDGAAPVPTLLGRRGQPHEVAATVAFLASDDASFITGTELVVDGGRSISRRPDAYEMAFGRENSRST